MSVTPRDGEQKNFTEELFEVLYRNPVRTFWVGAILILLAVGIEALSDIISERIPADTRASLHMWGKVLEVAQHLIRDGGISAIIAAMLASSIEKKAGQERSHALKSIAEAHEKHIKDLDERMDRYTKGVADSVLKGVFGSLLPEKFLHSFVSFVKNEQFLREFTTVEFKIVEFPVEQVKAVQALRGFVRVQIDLHYRIKNISNNKRNFPLSIFLEKSRIKEVDDKFVGISSLSIENTEYSADDIEGFNQKLPDTDLYKAYEYPIELDSGESAEVRIRGFLIKRQKDFITWSNLHGTLKFDVEFDFDSSRYSGGLIVYHPTREYNTHEAFSPSAPKRLAIPEPCLPYTVVELFWEPNTWLDDLATQMAGPPKQLPPPPSGPAGGAPPSIRA